MLFQALVFLVANAAAGALFALACHALVFLLLDASGLRAALGLLRPVALLFQLPLLVGCELRGGRVVIVAVEHLLEVVVALGEPMEGTKEIMSFDEAVEEVAL